MADNHCVNMENETRPWTIVADNPSLSCDQQFTLILKSDETKLVIPRLNAINKFFDGSGVFVVPQVGMLLERMSMSGEGIISFYSGAGTGEEEERYLLQSWKCSMLPNRIFSFESVITIVADDSCSYMLQYISNFDRNVNIFRNDRVAILSSGRSNNLQNRNGTKIIAYIEIGEWEESNVTVNMNLNFDSENTGSVGLMEQFAGPIDPYFNGTHKVEFVTDYFEIRWNPKELEPFEISNNQDIINIDIQVSHSNDEFECPDGYELISVDDERWCFTIFGPIPPSRGFSFLEAAAQCYIAGDSMPIVTSQEMNLRLAKFIYDFEVIEEAWIGLSCDPENGTWLWQDGQPLDYNALEGGTDKCSIAENVAIDKKSWRVHDHSDLMGKVVCSQRAHAAASSTTPELTTLHEFIGSTETTLAAATDQTTSVTSFAADTSTANTLTSTSTFSTITIISTLTSSNPPTTSTVDNSNGPPAWEIVLIVIGILLIIGCGIVLFLIVRRRRGLKDQILEEKLEIRKISQQVHMHYGIASDSEDEWEIDRRFVGIDYMNKLGEGAFGCVFLENADSQVERDFMSEIELMKRIGYHERLVNMLACVTSSRPILLICEYCANGDLLGFLRRRRKFMLERPEETESEEVITVKKQLMFAIQIAYGLEFLSSRGFIHRDVAARNVMVDQNEGCKIGDFGLGRSVGRENEHYHAQGGKLPLKWMSPEALDKYYFSTAADVWSYGVLLYEIVTLGGVPYAGWPAVELLSRLKRGERMDRPDNCSEMLFEIMCECWSEDPSDRPTFERLRKELGDLLENVHRDDYYLKLNAHAHYYVMESQASE
ncbi:hypothetical protein PRIPAC_77849 [Pristionchus pacificus]|uniref:Uncharacterized protein n=1 Tax=Pristionchus pacificus TaxID=54126 RepID=A0A2A6CJA2_PRIPA|nr:hypothetical protein PRIPAC_77849 [Pristionchus pacificus]|eukprot:PDM78196.1 protein kinase [Pristionchus pacificus]